MQKRVIDRLNVGTFIYSNGAGLGDFEGRCRRDYLSGSRITCICTPAGEELGMGDDLRLPERISVRTQCSGQASVLGIRYEWHNNVPGDPPQFP